MLRLIDGIAEGRPRIAVLGAGLMGRWHLDAAQRLGARVVAIVDPDLRRARALAAHCPGARSATTTDGVLRPSVVDLVHICSPASTHRLIALQAINAGIHALVEKPLTPDVSGTHDLLQAARRAGVLLCPVHQCAFQDGVAQAAKALGQLGEVCRIGFDICSAGEAAPAGTRDDVVTDILPHPLSLLRHLWPAAALEPAAWYVQHPTDGELLVSGRHAGAALTIGISMRARPTRFEMTLQCRGGSLRLDLFHGYCVVASGQVSRVRKAAQPFTDAAGTAAAATANLCRRLLRREAAYPGLRSLVRHFYQAVAAGAVPPIPPDDMLAVALAREAILRRMAQQVVASARGPAVPLPV